VLETLREVHQAALDGHRYRSDIDQHGRPEHWHGSLIGDCEDFALWCRDKLKEQGIESDLVYCKTEAGEGHMVCAVGGWILDCTQDDVKDRATLRYEWLKIGKPDGRWYAIEN
jgi:predicted transglutaminase-like cysteine proteinase